MIKLTEQHKYYMYTIAVDMRNGFDGLSGIIRTKLVLLIIKSIPQIITKSIPVKPELHLWNEA